MSSVRDLRETCLQGRAIVIETCLQGRAIIIETCLQGRAIITARVKP